MEKFIGLVIYYYIDKKITCKRYFYKFQAFLSCFLPMIMPKEWLNAILIKKCIIGLQVLNLINAIGYNMNEYLSTFSQDASFYNERPD